MHSESHALLRRLLLKPLCNSPGPRGRGTGGGISNSLLSKNAPPTLVETFMPFFWLFVHEIVVADKLMCKLGFGGVRVSICRSFRSPHWEQRGATHVLAVVNSSGSRPSTGIGRPTSQRDRAYTNHLGAPRIRGWV